MMIPLQGISQQKFIIEKDTIIGYTSDENRSIALLFVEGDMYKELCFTYEEVIEYKDSIIIQGDKHIEFLNNMIIVSTQLNENINSDLAKEKKITKRNKNIAKGSIGLNVILILILCLI